VPARVIATIDTALAALIVRRARRRHRLLRLLPPGLLHRAAAGPAAEVRRMICGGALALGAGVAVVMLIVHTGF
jgi:hypothetical protein